MNYSLAWLREPGMEHAPEDFRQAIYAEVRSVLDLRENPGSNARGKG